MEEAHDDDINRVVDGHDRPTRVNLEDLVPARTLAQVDAREAARARAVQVALRSRRLAFHVEDRRQLWQAYGQEFIEPDQLDWIDSLDPGSCLIDAGARTGRSYPRSFSYKASEALLTPGFPSDEDVRATFGR